MAKKKIPEQKESSVLTKISVEGFKCFRDKTDVEIRPLTILAGANSSGKTSIMQPLLLMKQTVLYPTEMSSALNINDSNVSLTSYDQIFGNHGGKNIEEVRFKLSRSDLSSIEFILKDGDVDLTWEKLTPEPKSFDLRVKKSIGINDPNESIHANAKNFKHIIQIHFSDVMGLLHVAGIRMSEPRHHAFLGLVDQKSLYRGRFDDYVASLLFTWQSKNRRHELLQLYKQLEELSLAYNVFTERHYSDKLYIKVSMISKSHKPESKYNIADVGIGVSQALPALVALIAAKPGQIVYIEQPEIHIHPRAQFDLAKILADASNRGVIVIAETHSDQLLLGIQHQVASGQIDTSKVKLHWFERDEEGASHVDSTDLDERGIPKKDWKADFDEVYMANQGKYLKASFNKEKKKLKTKTPA